MSAVKSRHVQRTSRCPLSARSGHSPLLRFLTTLQIIFDPVSGEVDANLAVVNMGMLRAAFFGGEDLDCLVFRADRIKELLGILDWHDPIVPAVGYEKRTDNVFSDVL